MYWTIRPYISFVKGVPLARSSTPGAYATRSVWMSRKHRSIPSMNSCTPCATLCRLSARWSIQHEFPTISLAPDRHRDFPCFVVVFIHFASPCFHSICQVHSVFSLLSLSYPYEVCHLGRAEKHGCPHFLWHCPSVVALQPWGVDPNDQFERPVRTIGESIAAEEPKPPRGSWSSPWYFTFALPGSLTSPITPSMC